MPFREAKLVRFTNMLCVLIVLGIVFYIPFSIFSGSYYLAAIEAVDALFVASALYFSHKKFYSVSKFMLIGIVNIFIYINACYIGNEANIQHFYVLINIVPFLVFRLNQVKHIAAAVTMTISWFIVYQFTYHNFVGINLPMEVQLNTKQIGTWLDFVLFAAGIYMLAKNNFDVEEALAGNNQLLQTQTVELKRSNEDLEQFAYIISHDLRVPLRNIINFLTLLERRHAPELKTEAKEFIGYSVSGSKRLERLIEDLLSYSKVGRNLPPTQTIETSELLKTIQFEMKDKVLRPNHKIVVENDMPALQNVHSTMIYHVFQNLITNGLKFNKNEKPEVVVSVKEKKNNYVFQVKDNGIGIPMEYKNKLFQMFKRLHTEQEFQGTGMGLAICKRIVNFYKGEVWFESETGNGTSFYFSIPK
jgi:signal transduction histidine kinase